MSGYTEDFENGILISLARHSAKGVKRRMKKRKKEEKQRPKLLNIYFNFSFIDRKIYDIEVRLLSLFYDNQRDSVML